MNLKPFKSIINAALPSVKVFIHKLPDVVSEGVLLLAPLSGNKLSADLPDYKVGKFQIIVRSINFESGYALAEQVMTAFQVVKRVTRDGMLINFIQPLHDPVAFPSSKGGFLEFSCNFETVYVEH